MTIDEKLQHFEDHIRESAENERQSILDEYQESLNRIFEEHKAVKEKQDKEHLVSERVALEHDLNKELSAKQIEIRHDLAGKQEEVRDEIFELVSRKLADFRKTPAYCHWICRKIMISKKVANGETMEVYLDPSDSGLKAEVEETTEHRVMISKTAFGGGMRAVIRSRHILIDDSFDTLIQDAKAGFSFVGGIRR
jgi:V/A-type H+-transporting ATPase subunit E